MFDRNSIDLANYPITARPKVGENDPPHLRLPAVAQAVAAELGMPADITLSSSGNGASLGYGGSAPTEFRIRILGVVKGRGSFKNDEFLGVSVVGTNGDAIVGFSEDVATTPRKCALLRFVRSNESAELTASLRALVEKKASGPVSKVKQARKPAASGLRFIASAFIRENGMRLSPDGRWLATAHENQHLTLWDTSSGREVWSKRAGGAGLKFVRAIAFSPDGKEIASGASSIKIFQVDGGKELASLTGHPKGELNSLSWSEHGLASTSAMNVRNADNSVALWDPQRETCLNQWSFQAPNSAQFVSSKKPTLVIRPDFGNDVVRIDVSSKKQVLHASSQPLCALFVTDAGIWVNGKEAFELLDSNSFEVMQTIPAKARSLVAVDATGEKLITAREEGDETFIQHLNAKGRTVAEWNLHSSAPGYRAHLDRLRANDLAVSDYSAAFRLIAAVVAHGRVYLATPLTLAAWSLDGEPVLMPAVDGAE